jgi:ligand-binding sensor domain-containing protein/signal transduction histidine kinase
MHPRVPIYGLLVVACLSGILVHGQDVSGVQYTSRRWSTADGLPYHNVQAIAQTSDGYLWLGTAKGLVRFDGLRFTVLTPTKAPGLADEKVSSLRTDREGALWIGTSIGLSVMRDGVISRVKDASLNGRIVVSLYQATDGAIWIGTDQGTLRWEDGRIHLFDRALMLSHSTARSFLADQNGVLWVATNKGLIRWQAGVETVFTDQNGLQTPTTRAVGRDRDGRLWVGTFKALSRFDDGSFRHFGRAEGLPDHNVSALYHDRHGTFWVGTYGGLGRRTGTNFITELSSDGTPYDQVNQFFEDREGNLWLAAKDGLIRLNARQFSSYTTRHGLAHHNVTAVIENRLGYIWTGTWGGGAQQFRNGKFLAAKPISGTGVVLSMLEANDHSLWIGNDFDGGLHRLKQGKYSHYWRDQGLGDDAIRVLMEDRHGNIWIGCSTALNVFTNGTFRRYTKTNGLSHNTIRCLAEDTEGRIWIGTGAGLTVWQDGRFTVYNGKSGFSDAPITALRVDSQQSVWIGTHGDGLYRWRDGTFRHYTTAHGLLTDEIADIIEDDLGSLWITSIHGIFSLAKNEFDALDRGAASSLNAVSYTEADGLVSSICNAVSKPATWKGRDGRLWFATAKGLVVTDPKTAERKNEVAPTVVIEEILFDTQLRSSGGTPTLNGKQDILKLGPGRGELEIRFTALSLRASEKNRFKYKLEGLDVDWVDAGTRRAAYYNNLPPGTYTFHVKASNNDGVWNEMGASVALRLKPHFWQTWWFGFGISAAALGTVASSVRHLEKRKLARRLARLEQQHAIERERARIAKDIHDDLGASLTRIAFLGELAEADKAKPESVESYVRRITGAARETVRSLDEIVWAVNPRKDTLNSLIEYVAHYANEFLDGTDIACRLNFPENIPDIALSSETRHELFLVIKESLNNALKHAHATEIIVTIHWNDGRLRVEICDNGRGFDSNAESASRAGNGLENMRKRVEAMNGRFELRSAAGKGTRVEMEVSLPITPSEAG